MALYVNFYIWHYMLTFTVMKLTMHAKGLQVGHYLCLMYL